MSDQNPQGQDPMTAGPSGTQRVSDESRPLPDPQPVLSNLLNKAFLIREHAGRGEKPRISIEGARSVVGREKADIVIDDQTISSQHFAIEHNQDGEFSIHDLGSSNGTALNGSEIESAPLKSGDRIQAGKTTFVFRTIQTIPWNQDS